ncbi:hypothetical protein MTO96_034305 [Rhipicephalus appendiculatus]
MKIRASITPRSSRWKTPGADDEEAVVPESPFEKEPHVVVEYGGTAAFPWTDPGTPGPRLWSSVDVQASRQVPGQQGPVGTGRTRGGPGWSRTAVGHEDRGPMASPAGIGDRAGRGQAKKSRRRLPNASPGGLVPLAGLRR